MDFLIVKSNGKNKCYLCRIDIKLRSVKIGAKVYCSECINNKVPWLKYVGEGLSDAVPTSVRTE